MYDISPVVHNGIIMKLPNCHEFWHPTHTFPLQIYDAFRFYLIMNGRGSLEGKGCGKFPGKGVDLRLHNESGWQFHPMN